MGVLAIFSHWYLCKNRYNMCQVWKSYEKCHKKMFIFAEDQMSKAFENSCEVDDHQKVYEFLNGNRPVDKEVTNKYSRYICLLCWQLIFYSKSLEFFVWTTSIYMSSKLRRVGVQTRALFLRRVGANWYLTWGEARFKL